MGAAKLIYLRVLFLVRPNWAQLAASKSLLVLHQLILPSALQIYETAFVKLLQGSCIVFMARLVTLNSREFCKVVEGVVNITSFCCQQNEIFRNQIPIFCQNVWLRS